MTRQNVLVRLHKDLLARREELSKQLAGELAYLHDSNAGGAAGDSADLALEAGGDDVSSQLAELDDRELNQIERALARWKHRTYGLCEGGSANCQKRIPVARLNALPYTAFCINCERELEKHLDGLGRPTKDNWGQVSDAQAPMQDQRINLSDVEMKMSGGRRG